MLKGILNKKEDIMLPEPAEEQIELWDKIEASLDEGCIKTHSLFHGLSDKLRKHLSSAKTSEKIKMIGENHRLPEKSNRQLPRIIGMVLLGETNIVDFVKTLQQKCGLAEEPARELARDINQAIFLPHKEHLKKLHNVQEWPRENESAEKPTQPEPGPRLEGNVVDLKG